MLVKWVFKLLSSILDSIPAGGGDGLPCPFSSWLWDQNLGAHPRSPFPPGGHFVDSFRAVAWVTMVMLDCRDQRSRPWCRQMGGSLEVLEPCRWTAAPTPCPSLKSSLCFPRVEATGVLLGSLGDIRIRLHWNYWLEELQGEDSSIEIDSC